MNKYFVVGFCFAFVMGCSDSSQTSKVEYKSTPAPTVAQKKSVPVAPVVPVKKSVLAYKILRQWKPQGGQSGTGMDILVDESAKKQEVLDLAKSLNKEFMPKGSVIISIFDKEDAWKNRENTNYPEKEYFKHYLVEITYNKNNGFSEIKWCAENREK